MCKERGKYGPYTGKKKAVNKHYPRGNPDVGLTRQSNIFKATLNVFNETKEIIYKILKENMRTISHQIQNISKMIEIIKKNQMENLELKYVI